MDPFKRPRNYQQGRVSILYDQLAALLRPLSSSRQAALGSPLESQDTIGEKASTNTKLKEESESLQAGILNVLNARTKLARVPRANYESIIVI